MVMLRSAGVATKVAKKVLGEKGIKVPSPKKDKKVKIRVDYLQH